MIEKFEVLGYRKVLIHDNDYENYTWVQIASREFDNYPTENEKLSFCAEYNLDKIVVRQIELNIFK